MSTPLRFPVLPSLLAAGTLLALMSAAAQHSGHNAPAARTPAAPPLPLVAQQPTIVAVPPSITETSAYLTLRNTGRTAIKLVGVSADIAGHSMFMKTLKQQNMMGMLPAAGFVVPAGGTLVMKSDGDHVMLMKLKRPLKVGEVLPIVLQASDGRRITVKATVKKP